MDNENLLLFAYVVIASWLLGRVEAISIFLLREWAFRFGPVAKVREIQGACPVGLLAASKTKETENLKYRVLDGNRCVFRRKAFSDFFRLHTPFEIKGMISWSAHTLTVKGRYSLWATMLSIIWLAMMTIEGFRDIFKGDPGGLTTIVFGILIGGGIFAFFRWLELRRFDRFAKEVEAALGVENKAVNP
jgi:hypothetical protein